MPACSTALTPGLVGSLALLPLAMLQGSAVRRRLPILPPPLAPHHGRVEGKGPPLRLLAIGESSVCGIGVSRGDETVAAVAARDLALRTNRPVIWRALGLSGSTVRDGMAQLLPRVHPQSIDLCIVAFGVNDTTSYRSPKAFADDLEMLVTSLRRRIGHAAMVIAGVAPINCFPALPWPLRTILGWRSKALQAAMEGLARKLPRLAVERFTTPFAPELFSIDGFHPNAKAHQLWGAEIATLALPLLQLNDKRRGRRQGSRRQGIAGSDRTIHSVTPGAAQCPLTALQPASLLGVIRPKETLP